MPTRSIQFHATRSEVSELVARWVAQLGLWLAVEYFGPPYRAERLDTEMLTEFAIPDEANRLIMSISPVNMGTESTPLGILASNPSCITLLVGKEGTEGLGESMIQASSDDPQLLRKWGVVRRELSAAFRRGCRVVNVATGASSISAGHYYSPGAKTWYDQGRIVLGLAPNLRYEFDD
jgi:hypothetical protein